MGEAVIVAGIGCRKGAEEKTVIAAIRHAAAAHGLQMSELGLLATGEIKRHEAGITAAAMVLDVPVLVLDDDRLRRAGPQCLTNSGASAAAAGIPSLSEAAAIVGAGTGGRLLGPRIAMDGVTCALARTAEPDGESGTV